MESIVSFANEIVWSKALVYGLLLTGVLFSFMMRFFQVRHFKEMIRLMFQGKNHQRVFLLSKLSQYH